MLNGDDIMTMQEELNFYKNDKRKYDIKNNKEFLNWLGNAINNGYKPLYKINELQKLVNFISNWIEFKYPEKELMKDEGINYSNFKDIPDISTYMSTEQLLYRLDDNLLNILTCRYRSNCGYQMPVLENGKAVWRQNIGLKIFDSNNKNDSFIFIYADSNTGKIKDTSYLEKYVDIDNLYLDDLYSLLKDNKNLKLDELESTIINHKYDIELRDKIFELVSLKLLYSKNTNPIRGYKRACLFTDEFNNYFNTDIIKTNFDGNKTYIKK